MLRRFAVIAACLALFSVPVAAASPASDLEPYEFTDAVGDVAREWQPYSGGLADTNDIVRAAMREEADELAFELELRDLSGLPGPDVDCEFHAQYALSFQTHEAHEGYSMRATYRACTHSILLGPWTFQIHDRQEDQWTFASGHIDNATIHWTASLSDFGLDNDSRLFAWTVNAWNSYEDGEQSNDDAQGVGWYDLGEGPFYGTEDLDPVEATGSFAFDDSAADVESGGQTVQGSGADTTDILSVRLEEQGADLVFALDLRDLSGLEYEVYEPGFHAQYAVSFLSRQGHEGYSTRASFGGEEYTGSPAGAWRFQVHDKQTDEWPQAVGHVNGSTILWTIPRADLGVEAGDTLEEWVVQTWNSYDERDQYGDWASTDATYRLGETAESSAASPEPSADAETLEGEEPLELPAPSVLVVLAALTLFLFVRRR